jgi:hypothetical protein
MNFALGCTFSKIQENHKGLKMNGTYQEEEERTKRNITNVNKEVV